MSRNNDDAAISAFLRSRGVTRCPTACAAPTHAYGSAADRQAFAAARGATGRDTQAKAQQAWARAIGVAA